MLVLHGSWVRNRFMLWGETVPSAEADARTTSRSGEPPLSPFDAGRNEIALAVQHLTGSNGRARAAHARPVIVHLPTLGKHPVPSRTYLAPLSWSESAKATPVPRLWRVTALPLSYPELTRLFALCASSLNAYDSLTARCAAGNDLIAQSHLWRFAGAIVARQSFLPSIRDGKSRWMAALDRPDTRRLAAFVAEMPPSAAAMEGAVPAENYALSFFDDSVDVILRHSVSTTLTRVHAQRSIFSDPHSAWLASLRSLDPTIRWDSREEIDEFAELLENWSRPVVYGQQGAYRLGFRVTDPEGMEKDGESPKWRLTPLVTGEGRTLPFSPATLRKLPVEVREHMLIALGQAALLCPLFSGEGLPAGFTIALDGAEVQVFLREKAPLLKAAGYGIFAPDWWHPVRMVVNGHGSEVDGTRLRIRAVSAVPAGDQGFFSLDALVNVKWEIVLGDETLSQKDVEKILNGGKPLVKWHSRWIFADQAKLSSALSRFEKLTAGKTSVRDLVHIAIGAGLPSSDGVEIDMGPVGAGGEIGLLLQRLRGEGGGYGDIAIPGDFRGELRPYQKRGLAWLAFLSRWGFGACLADDMGLGKTIEAIALFLHLREEGEKRPFLIVCPMSIMTKWAREFAKFAPTLKVGVYHGEGRPEGEAFVDFANGVDAVITSYQLLCMNFASVSRVLWGVALLDEAQNIKNPSTNKSHAARSLKAGWKLALTGTPVENSVRDLWALMDFLNPGLLLSRSQFAEVFQRPIQTGVDPTAGDRLKRITGPFFLRRLKTDPEIVSDMPPRIEEKVYCSLSSEQAGLYSAEIRDISRLLSTAANGASRRGAVLSLLTRLKQICNHPEHYFRAGLDEDGTSPVRATARKQGPGKAGAALPAVSEDDPLAQSRSGKLARFDSLLDDVLAAGECALVFTQYAVMGHLLQRHLRARLGFDVPFLYGSVPLRKRDEMIARFQRPDGPPVFILSIKAGGMGIDLTRANHVFHFDRWWNPAVENQATDRAHRLGQRKSVFIHTFICEGTLESRIDDLITGKTELARQLIASGDSWLTKLSDEKLREILALFQSSVPGD